MKMKYLEVLVLGLALACAMPARAQVDPDAQKLAESWTQAYNNHDKEALAAVYTEDARVMLHGEPTLSGRERIAEFWARDFKAGNPLTVLKVTHSIRGVDMILVHGDYQVVDRDSGRTLGFGRFAHIWTETGNGTWRLDRDLWNQPYDGVFGPTRQ